MMLMVCNVVWLCAASWRNGLCRLLQGVTGATGPDGRRGDTGSTGETGIYSDDFSVNANDS